MGLLCSVGDGVARALSSSLSSWSVKDNAGEQGLVSHGHCTVSSTPCPAGQGPMLPPTQPLRQQSSRALRSSWARSLRATGIV